MKTAQNALAANHDSHAALGLFVAANLKRENQLPDGMDDPIYGSANYTPSFYATVFGTRICRDVLAMAIDAGDTVLVRDAIEALSQTTGGSNLFAGAGGESPLLAALQYPDRRVRYDAALVLGKALPKDSFAGDFSVVPMLGSAIRAGAQTFALVLANNDETRRVNVDRLMELNFTIVGQAGNLDQAAVDLAQAIGVDLVIVQESVPPRALPDLVTQIRAQPKTAVAAIVIIADAIEVPSLELEFANNRWVKITADVGDEAFSLVVDEALERASGGRITEAEAEMYAFEAMGALRDIAVSNSAVYDIADAEPALMDALTNRYGGAKLLIARTLTYIDSAQVQRRLFDAALEGDQDQVELLNNVADSIKRWGYKCEPRHLDGLLAIIANSTSEVAEAAARVHGAINLPPVSALNLLPEQKQ